MDLYYIDYISVSGRGWLHRVPVWAKMFAVTAVIVLLLSFASLAFEAAVVGVMLLAAISARIPMRAYIPLSLYPVVFLVVIFLSMEGLTLYSALVLGLRVLGITASVVLLLLSTSYPAIFGTLGRVLPGFVVAALFFTYRSIFVISGSINDIRTAMHLRGGIDRRHPVATLQTFGSALGHLMVHAIETGRRMADGLKLRGFANRVYYQEEKK